MSHLSTLSSEDTDRWTEMKSGFKRQAPFPLEIATAHWIDFDSVVSKGAALTADSSGCNYLSSSSSFSSSPLTLPLPLPLLKKCPSVETIPHASLPTQLRDHCGMGNYWVVPTTTKRRRRSKVHLYNDDDWGSDLGKDGTINKSGNKNRTRKKERVTKKVGESTNASIVTLSDSSTISLSSSCSNENKNSIISKVTESNVKTIGVPGVRSRWAWIDNSIEAKTDSSPTSCFLRKKTKNENPKPATTNTKEASIPHPKKATKSKKASTPTTASGSYSWIHEPNTKVSPILKDIQDHLGIGSYWIEPTQRRKQMKPNRYVDTRKEKHRKAAASKTRKDVSSIGESRSRSRSSIANRSAEMHTKIIACKSSKAASVTRTSTTALASKPKATIPVRVDVANHQKLTFQAIQGTDQPICRYALDLISLVCNNSYNNTSDSVGFPLQEDTKEKYRCWPYRQVHRVLDKPPPGHTFETESEKERVMRLQVRNFQSRLRTQKSHWMRFFLFLF